MSKYRIKEPVTYVEGKKVVMHKRPAELVTIDDDVARKLGDSVELMGQPDSEPKAGEQKSEAKSEPKPGAQAAKDK